MASTFFSDIRPLCRDEDISCMTARGVKLGDADWMCDARPGNGFEDHGNARVVFSALSRGSMPPDRPWRQAQLNAYDAWMRGGFLK